MRNGQLLGKDQEAEKERLAVPGGILRRGAIGRKNEQNFLKIKQTRLIFLSFILTVVLTCLCGFRGCWVEFTFKKRLQYNLK